MTDVESLAYQRLGVSAAKADVEAAAASLGGGIFPHSFCRILPDVFANDPNSCVVSHSDGAGTKAILAYLKYRMFGRADAFRSIAHDAIVMNLDDVVCSGAVSGFAYVSIINRNSNRVGADVLSEVIEGTLDTIRSLKDHGVDITFCGGETADVGDVVRSVLVDGALTTRMPRSSVVRNELRVGHVVVALASDGPPAKYESAPNSGIGSNGLTLARHALLNGPSLARALCEISDDAQEEQHLYTGPYSPMDNIPNTGFTVLDALLSPTRTFAPIVAEVLKRHFDQVSGIFHNTGGGQFKSLKVANGVRIIKSVPSEIPEIFHAIRESARLPWLEMARIFNLGWRMELYCDEKIAPDIVNLARAFGVSARVVGHVERGTDGRRELTLSVLGESTTVHG